LPGSFEEERKRSASGPTAFERGKGEGGRGLPRGKKKNTGFSTKKKKKTAWGPWWGGDRGGKRPCLLGQNLEKKRGNSARRRVQEKKKKSALEPQDLLRKEKRRNCSKAGNVEFPKRKSGRMGRPDRISARGKKRGSRLKGRECRGQLQFKGKKREEGRSTESRVRKKGLQEEGERKGLSLVKNKAARESWAATRKMPIQTGGRGGYRAERF